MAFEKFFCTGKQCLHVMICRENFVGKIDFKTRILSKISYLSNLDKTLNTYIFISYLLYLLIEHFVRTNF